MPTVNEYLDKIPVFYRKTTMEMLMFGYVTALRERCGMTLAEAIKDFLDLFGIEEYEYTVRSAKVKYNRMLNNYIYVKKIVPLQDPASFLNSDKEQVEYIRKKSKKQKKLKTKE